MVGSSARVCTKETNLLCTLMSLDRVELYSQSMRGRGSIISYLTFFFFFLVHNVRERP